MAFVAWVSGGSSEVPTDLSNLVLDPIPRECEASCEDGVTEECGSPLYPGHRYNPFGGGAWENSAGPYDGSYHCMAGPSCEGHLHEGGCTQGKEDLEELLALALATLDAPGLGRLLEHNPERLRLDLERRSIQMLG